MNNGQPPTKFEKMEFMLKPSSGSRVSASIMRVLPDWMSTEDKHAWITNAIEYLSENWHNLGDCDANAVYAAILAAATTALSLATKGGKAYLVPFGEDCQFMPGYKGLKELALRSESVLSIVEKPVFESDEFDYEEGNNAYIRHKPDIKIDRGDDKGMVGAYAIAYMREGPPIIAFKTMPELRKVAAMSKGGARKVREVWPVTMHIKAPVRFLCERIPSNPLLEMAMNAVRSGESRRERERADANERQTEKQDSIYADMPEAEASEPEAERETVPADGEVGDW